MAKYLKATVEVALVLELEEIDMPTLLDKYREEGAARLVSAEIVELTREEAQKALAGAFSTQ